MQFTRRKDFDGLEPSDIHGKGYFLCSDHFEDSQNNCPWEKKRLVWNAVPTLFSTPNTKSSAEGKDILYLLLTTFIAENFLMWLWLTVLGACIHNYLISPPPQPFFLSLPCNISIGRCNEKWVWCTCILTTGTSKWLSERNKVCTVCVNND